MAKWLGRRTCNLKSSSDHQLVIPGLILQPRLSIYDLVPLARWHSYPINFSS